MTTQDVQLLREHLTLQSSFMIVSKSQFSITNTPDSPIVFDDKSEHIIQFKRGNNLTSRRVEIAHMPYEEIEQVILYKSDEEAPILIDELLPDLSDEDKQFILDGIKITRQKPDKN